MPAPLASARSPGAYPRRYTGLAMNDSPLRGVLSPVVTPFEADLAPSMPRFVRHCRSLVAQGPAHDPARVRSRNATGQREIYATAERIVGEQGRTTLKLACPSGDSTVYVHDVAKGRYGRCESVTFNYVTYEWTEWVRWREVE